MTAMSDVTVLLLTFFMLTATFLPSEPVRVETPSSVVEIKIPESNLMTILVMPDGKVCLNLDRPSDRMAVLESVGKSTGMTFTDNQIASFGNQEQIGVPLESLPEFLSVETMARMSMLRHAGIPTDSLDNQLKIWLRHARAVNNDLSIAVKADRSTPYPVVKNVINTLVSMNEHRFNLITNLRRMPEGY